MIIYLVTNKINKKQYVGITIRSLTYRRNIHKQTWKLGRSPNSKLYQAFSKYGYDNFEWEILEKVDTVEHLKQQEMFWIGKLNTKILGYNSTEGGDFNPNLNRFGKDNPKSKKFRITHPDGTIEEIHGISEWCRKHGLHKQGLIPVAQGKYLQYKGYKAEYIE